VGIEPTRPHGQRILSPRRLPFRHRPAYVTGSLVHAARHGSRGQEATAGFEPAHKGFADPCLTTWLRRPKSGYSTMQVAREQALRHFYPPQAPLHPLHALAADGRSVGSPDAARE
jgi:hypothetical protein